MGEDRREAKAAFEVSVTVSVDEDGAAVLEGERVSPIVGVWSGVGDGLAVGAQAESMAKRERTRRMRGLIFRLCAVPNFDDLITGLERLVIANRFIENTTKPNDSDGIAHLLFRAGSQNVFPNP